MQSSKKSRHAVSLVRNMVVCASLLVTGYTSSTMAAECTVSTGLHQAIITAYTRGLSVDFIARQYGVTTSMVKACIDVRE